LRARFQSMNEYSMQVELVTLLNNASPISTLHRSDPHTSFPHSDAYCLIKASDMKNLISSYRIDS
jgi:hypothetical protein